MLAPNTLIQSRYRIVRHIAGGGMGSVYEAVDERLDHTVALKQLVLTDVLAQQSFEREAKILAPLRHATLPNVSDYFSDPAGRFLVMQYIPGDDLAVQLSRRGQPFPVAQVLAWAEQLLRGLDYLHSRGIVHRDIKPQNLKFTAEGEIILLDFGIAKHTTQASILAATPGFAPIEQIQGQGTDARSDLYALGATLYCLLTKTRPEVALARLLAESRHQPDPVEPLHALNPQVAPPVSAVIMQAMALHPDDRPASAAAMLQMLTPARAAQPTVVPPAMPPTMPVAAAQTPPPQPVQPAQPVQPDIQPPARPRQRIPRQLVLTLVAVLLLALVAAQFLPDPPSPPPEPTIMTVPIGATGPVIELVEIPAGRFFMGSRDDNPLSDADEQPQRRLRLDTYWIGKTEVTNAQFRPFVEGDGYTNADYWTDAGWRWRTEFEITSPAFWNDPDWNGDDYPVIGVSWYEAAAYARWLSVHTGHDFRLPTEAEWEKAARGPRGFIWPWGNAWVGENCNCANEDGATRPVGSYPAGASPYGVLDMAGNAWEWTATQWRKTYPYIIEDEWHTTYREGEMFRALRGGTYESVPKRVRTAYRDYATPDKRDYNGLSLRLLSPAVRTE